AGSLLVPALSLLESFIISVLGSIIGSIFLALAGLIGSDYGVPTMVSLRPILGRVGSYLPTILNVIQLIGWTGFELMIMGVAASNISGPILGEYTRPFWIIIFAIWCTALALGGPLIVVRQWLEKAAIWLVYFSTAWITFQVFSRPNVFTILFKPGDGSLPILLALDLVIAMPISWWPLVSDYNRFSKDSRSGFLGTFLGYTFANTWFYFLGASIALIMGIKDIVSSISMLFLGNLALILILVDETDNAFADIYSTAVSLQNISPKTKQWKLVLVAAALGIILTIAVPLEEYEWFLLMIGGLFVPLLGVVISEYAIRKRSGGFRIEEFYEKSKKIGAGQLISWFMGIILYFAITNLCPQIGASLPSFALSAILNLFFHKIIKV
ncbi:MAG TPA: putative hydroxymethylpyrimidine transporter CytX, partial [Nitrososphaeria archaeon]|nr:putative hydroxymethylpyrimidine transporter CytX [Nitrososphaeria archaeon]